MPETKLWSVRWEKRGSVSGNVCYWSSQIAGNVWTIQVYNTNLYVRIARLFGKFYVGLEDAQGNEVYRQVVPPFDDLYLAALYAEHCILTYTGMNFFVGVKEYDANHEFVRAVK